jgi:type II secretory pathway pseudopilin PulG
LVELAVALLIITLLLGSILVPLQTQVEQRKISDTQKILDQTMEALIGFAAANGRLPCPASSTSNGIESLAGGGVCTNPYNGFVPAATLGLSPTDAQGYLIDSWGTSAENRIRYAVTTANGSAFTTANGMRNAGMSVLTPNLTICSTATGIAGSNCGAGAMLANSAPAVIYSLGKNAATGGTGADESENPNTNSADNDRVFVWHTAADSNAPNGEFDDILTWLSPNVLYNRMISAGQLP